MPSPESKSRRRGCPAFRPLCAAALALVAGCGSTPDEEGRRAEEVRGQEANPVPPVELIEDALGNYDIGSLQPGDWVAYEDDRNGMDRVRLRLACVRVGHLVWIESRREILGDTETLALGVDPRDRRIRKAYYRQADGAAVPFSPRPPQPGRVSWKTPGLRHLESRSHEAAPAAFTLEGATIPSIRMEARMTRTDGPRSSSCTVTSWLAESGPFRRHSLDDAGIEGAQPGRYVLLQRVFESEGRVETRRLTGWGNDAQAEVLLPADADELPDPMTAWFAEPAGWTLPAGDPRAALEVPVRQFALFEASALGVGSWVEYRRTEKDGVTTTTDRDRISCVRRDLLVWLEFTASRNEGQVLLVAVDPILRTVVRAYAALPGEEVRPIRIGNATVANPMARPAGAGHLEEEARRSTENLRAGGIKYRCRRGDVTWTVGAGPGATEVRLTVWTSAELPFPWRGDRASEEAAPEAPGLVRLVREESGRRLEIELLGSGKDARPTVLVPTKK